MMGQIEWEQLAKKNAYDMLTCPGSTEDIDSVLESWHNDQHHPDVTIWEPFEKEDPDGLMGIFDIFECAFLNFAREILGK